jgi:ACS family hexuronate transporter-like MFS transporter
MKPPETQSPSTAIPSTAVRRDCRRRWGILALLFVALFLIYFDRQVISLLKPEIIKDLGLAERDYANIVSAFLFAYMFAYALSGRFVDRAGGKPAMALFVGVWSLANIATGFTRTLWQMVACRVVLGVVEPGCYPGALRVATSWFPAGLRGRACAIYQAGSATAAVIAPPLVMTMAALWGWRPAFILPGILGLLWLAGWRFVMRNPSPEYAAVVAGGNTGALERVPLGRLLRNRNLWGIVLARLVSDQVWYFCLFWMAGYMREHMNLSLVQAGLIVWLPFLFADLGGVLSGVLSDRLVARGMEPWRARKSILLGVALLGPAAAVVPFTTSVPLAVGAFCMVALVCQVYLFTITSLVGEIFPRTGAAGVLGISGSFGALGGMLSSQLIGALVGGFGYMPIFLMLACLHPLASAILAVAIRPRKSEKIETLNPAI